MICVQEKSIALLSRLESSGNLPHTLLFTGEDEAYAKKAACKFAQWLFHKDTDEQRKSLSFLDFWQGECSCVSCAQVFGLIHPDFCLYDNTQFTIGEVREITAKFSLAPFVSSKKIAVIAKAHHMTDAAANAFLKILEEPRGDAIFILIANARSSLLPTIVSRALEVRFVAAREALLKRYFEADLKDTTRVLLCFETGALYEQFFEDQRFTFKKKSELCAILDIWLLKLREKIIAADAPHIIFALRQILGAKKLLMTSNANPELLMEELHLKLQGIRYA